MTSTSNQSFYYWMRQFKAEPDTIRGFFTRAMALDKNFPKTKKKKSIIEYLDNDYNKLYKPIYDEWKILDRLYQQYLDETGIFVECGRDKNTKIRYMVKRFGTPIAFSRDGIIPIFRVLDRKGSVSGNHGFFCRYCKCWHRHEITWNGISHRSAHCGSESRSPYRSTGYYVTNGKFMQKEISR